MPFELLIISDIRFVREGLADALGRDGVFRIAGVAVDLEHARRLLVNSPPHIILVDTALPQGIAAVEVLRECARDAKIVAFALTEIESEVITWALAGISGYIPRDTPLCSLVELLHKIVGSEQVFPNRIASGMLRWISQHAADQVRPDFQGSQHELTAREQEVARLLGANMSNKEIARRLGIGLATTKSHVHNILSKLQVRKRALAAMHVRRGKSAAFHPPGDEGVRKTE